LDEFHSAITRGRICTGSNDIGRAVAVEYGRATIASPLFDLMHNDLRSEAERPELADSTTSTKTSEADIREDWAERANGHNGRGRVSRAPN